VLRHAKASREGGKSDFERPLTRRGRRDAPRMARWLKSRDLVPDLIVSSPARRASETAELVLDEVGLGDAVRLDERVYNADVAALLAVLAELPDDARRVLLVGHNPGLEDLVRHLAGPAAQDPEKGKFFPTCALAHLRFASAWSGIGEGGASLVAIVSWSRKNRAWKVRQPADHG
jgi:phosphohistidine phosphatase